MTQSAQTYLIATLASLTISLSLWGWLLLGHSVGDSIYLTALAFSLDGQYLSFGNAETGLNWQLKTARFLGAVTTFVTITALFLGFLGDQWTRLRARHRRQHVLLVGANGFGAAEAQKLATSQTEKTTWLARLFLDRPAAITVLDQAEVLEGFRAFAPRVLTVAIGENALLQVSPVWGQPDRIVLALPDNMQNIALARAIVRHARANSLDVPHITMRIDSGEVLRDLRLYAPELALVDVISAPERHAIALADKASLVELATLRGQTAPHVLFLGFGKVGYAVAEQYLRRSNAPNLAPMHVTIVDRDIEAAKARFDIEAPHLMRRLLQENRLAFHAVDGMSCNEQSVRDWLEYREKQQPYTAIVVATGNDGQNAGIAMRLRDIQSSRMSLRAPILMRNRTGHGAASGNTHDLTGGVLHFGSDDISANEANGSHLDANVAETLHNQWRQRALTEGRHAPAWEELSAVEKQPNFAAARSKRDAMHMLKLVPDHSASTVGLNIAPEVARLMKAATSDMRLAQAEHERWQVDRLLAGYQTAPNGMRDDEKRLHPDLVAFERLSDANQEKDKDILKALLNIGTASYEATAKSGDGASWRRLLRVGVVGPIWPAQSLRTSVRETLGTEVLNRLGDAHNAYALEILTPDAPGFDRLATVALAQAWEAKTGRKARLLKIHALTDDGLDRKALGVEKAPPLTAPNIDLKRLEEIQEQSQAIANLALVERLMDLRPLHTSNTELLRDQALCRQSIDGVNERILALSDVMVLGLADAPGPVTSAVRNSSENRARIDVTAKGASVAGDWSGVPGLSQ